MENTQLKQTFRVMGLHPNYPVIIIEAKNSEEARSLALAMINKELGESVKIEEINSKTDLAEKEEADNIDLQTNKKNK